MASDVALAIGLLALAVAFDLPHDRRPLAVAVVLTVFATVPVAARRRFPAAMLAGLGAATAAHILIEHSSVVGCAGVLIAVFSLANQRSRHLSLSLSAAVLGLLTAAFAAVPPPAATAAQWQLVITALATATAWAIGDNLRTRRAYLEAVKDRAARQAAERLEETRRAVAEERSCIARELHDVVAHHVSVMTLQAGAAAALLGDPEHPASQSVAVIEATGASALTELRRLLGVLRAPDDAAPFTPQPGLAAIDGLIQTASHAGVPTRMRFQRTRRPLPDGAEVSAYRIVQEALTNVFRHAGPSSADICVTFSDSALELEVTDTGCGPPQDHQRADPGHGLAGMRERVELFGGDLHAGPGLRGGYTIRARLPIAETGTS